MQGYYLQQIESKTDTGSEGEGEKEEKSDIEITKWTHCKCVQHQHRIH